MADFILEDDQNVDVAVSLKDAGGNAVAVSDLDAGSLTATFSDTTEFTVTVADDQSSINVKALGPLTTGDVITVNATYGGGTPVPIPGTLTFDVAAGSPQSIGLTPGTPESN